MKQAISIILILTLLFTFSGCMQGEIAPKSSFQNERDSHIVEDTEKEVRDLGDDRADFCIDLITALVQAANCQRWDEYINFYVNDAKEDFEGFIENTYNQENHLGLFNIKTASIHEIKEMSIEDIEDFISVRSYQAQYGEVKIYYCGVDYTVYEESKYYFNGVNYYLIAVVKENDEWKIAEMSDAPIEALIPKGVGFNSEAEKASLERFYERILS